MSDERIEITDTRDQALMRMAQGAKMNKTVLPSGYCTPPRDMIVDGMALVPAMAREDRPGMRGGPRY